MFLRINIINEKVNSINSQNERTKKKKIKIKTGNRVKKTKNLVCQKQKTNQWKTFFLWIDIQNSNWFEFCFARIKFSF